MTPVVRQPLGPATNDTVETMRSVLTGLGLRQSVQIGVAGACGRMGRSIIECIGEDAGATFAGAGPPGSEVSKLQVGDTTIDLAPDIGALTDHVDVIIDFTTPEATIQHATWCLSRVSHLSLGPPA